MTLSVQLRNSIVYLNISDNLQHFIVSFDFVDVIGHIEHGFVGIANAQVLIVRLVE